MPVRRLKDKSRYKLLPFEIGLKLAVNRKTVNSSEPLVQRCGNWRLEWPGEGHSKGRLWRISRRQALGVQWVSPLATSPLPHQVSPGDKAAEESLKADDSRLMLLRCLCRAKREHLERCWRLSTTRQDQNLVLTVLYVPNSLKSSLPEPGLPGRQTRGRFFQG